MPTVTATTIARPALLALIVGAWAAATPISHAAPPAPCQLQGPPPPFPSIRLESVVKSLKAPLGLFRAGDGTGRLFLVEQQGTIQTLKKGQLLKTPFLDIRDRVTSGGEMGLLGLAFHPAFA